MSTHNIRFYRDMEKIISNYHQILLLNNFSDSKSEPISFYSMGLILSVLQHYLPTSAGPRDRAVGVRCKVDVAKAWEFTMSCCLLSILPYLPSVFGHLKFSYLS